MIATWHFNRRVSALTLKCARSLVFLMLVDILQHQIHQLQLTLLKNMHMGRSTVIMPLIIQLICSEFVRPPLQTEPVTPCPASGIKMLLQAIALLCLLAGRVGNDHKHIQHVLKPSYKDMSTHEATMMLSYGSI
jgi:hypothetical protein